MYSTKQLATLSGVSARTLRYYDQIGLLTPPLAANGYRQYGLAEVDRLQLILTYRALGFALADIQTLLDQPPAQRVQALAQQEERHHTDSNRHIFPGVHDGLLRQLVGVNQGGKTRLHEDNI